MALFAVGVVLIAVLLAGGWNFVNLITEAGAEIERHTFVSVASIAADSLDPQTVASLTGSPADASLSSFGQLRGKLTKILRAVPNARSVYLLGQHGDTVIFLTRSEDKTSAGYSPPGQASAGVPPEARQVFGTRAAGVASPYQDRSGQWAPSFAPIFDPASRKVVAVLGIDMPANRWRGQLERYRSAGNSMLGLIAVLLGVALFLQARSQRRISVLNMRLKGEIGELEKSNRIVESSSTVLFSLAANESWPVTYVSRNIERYGYKAEQVMGPLQNWLTLFHPDDMPQIRENLQNIASGKSQIARNQFRFRKGDGSWAWVDTSLTIIRDKTGRVTGGEGLMFDITETKDAETRIAYLAGHDGLTGLANRSAFMERLQLACVDAKRSGRTFAVLYIDLDHFKDINDTFGHERGDQLLKMVALRLSGDLRLTDALGRFNIARFGGDEFAVLELDVADASDAAALAQRLLKSIAQPFTLEGKNIHITASIGISLYGEGAVAPNDLLVQADLALYRAKEAGRDQFHFHSSDLDVQVRERVAIGEELHLALKNGQLQLYYQPQVEIPSGRITGLEALLRWNHPQRGLVSPTQFISVAEKSGLIVALGSWVIEESCRQILAWRKEGLSVPLMGINVSAAQFRNPGNLLSEVKDALQKLGGGQGILELELTESVLIDTTEAHSDVLHRLRDIGVHIAIDDFGTGYSSLQYLHAYPVDRIKIAQQFMHRTPVDAGDSAIVNATIRLGEALKLETVAEGVETLEQLVFLAKAGCRTIQGFYFSKPVPAAEMAPLLRQGKFDFPLALAV